VVAVHPSGRRREAVGEEVDEEVGEVRTQFEGLRRDGLTGGGVPRW
jgi:hypothetical protein